MTMDEILEARPRARRARSAESCPAPSAHSSFVWEVLGSAGSVAAACSWCGPQVGASAVDTLVYREERIGNQVMTLGSASWWTQVLTGRARVEAEDAQRVLLAALNGLAGLMLLAGDAALAVGTYRQARAAAPAAPRAPAAAPGPAQPGCTRAARLRHWHAVSRGAGACRGKQRPGRTGQGTGFAPRAGAGGGRGEPRRGARRPAAAPAHAGQPGRAAGRRRRRRARRPAHAARLAAAGRG